MIKMLVLDIDGTIQTREKPISDTLKKHVFNLKKSGIKVIIATGRMHQSASFVAKELGTDDPIISYQGGLIIDSKGNILWKKLLDEPHAREIIACLRKDKTHINTYVNDILYVEKENELIKDYVSDKNIEYNLLNTLDDLDYSNLNKILAIDKDTDKIIKLVEKYTKKYKEDIYVVRSTPYFCEFSNPEATKGNGIRFLAKYWNINQDEIMAVGDQDNDIEMLKAAGVRVAMGNATKDLKEVSNFITKTVDEDGVAYAIEKFIELKEPNNAI